MSLKDDLTDSLRKYMARVGEYAERLNASRAKVTYTPLGWRSAVLKAVESLESQPGFDELVRATMTVYGGNRHPDTLIGRCRTPVKHFFRRSGVYLDCFEKGRVEEFEGIRTLYDQAFTARKVPVTYLAPLEGVRFTELRGGVIYSWEKPLDFGSFLIRRYTPDELSELVDNRINVIFYPHASWDVGKFSRYWFLVTRGSEDVPGIGKIVLDFSDLDSIRRKPVPKELSPLCPALYKVVLFDWRSEGLQEKKLISLPWSGFRWCDLGIQFSVERLEKHRDKLDWEPWYGFRIPVVGKVAHNLIDSPPPAPDATRLEAIPNCNHMGEEIEGSAEWFGLNEEGTLEFEQFVKEEVDLLDDSLLEAWPFFRVALEHLTKAFLTDPFGSAPEQLLWHITSIEALLGRSEDEEVVGPLARRLSRILGSNSSQRDRINYQFLKLYQVRSDLVHGNPWQDYSSAYLYEARNFARRACLWFLKLARDCREQSKPLPSRDEILSDIDSGDIFRILS